MLFIIILYASLCNAKQSMTIQNLHQQPILFVKHRECKLQLGTINLVHPINVTNIEDTINDLINIVYTKLTTTNPLTNLAKYRIKKLHTDLLQIKPQHHHRTRRWDQLGTAWKWLAGNPDANDLRLINDSMNHLIDQNNMQYKVNQQLNAKIQQLTGSVNTFIKQLNEDKILINDLEILTMIANLDVMSKLLEDIQEAIILSKTSTASNRILSMHEIMNIKNLLQEQGISLNYPDEALQYVTPKFAASKDTLLYILHVPQLENVTSVIMRLYPLINNDEIISNLPHHLIRSKNLLYTTSQPDNFVQKAANIQEFQDKCIEPILFGKSPKCNTTNFEATIRKLITDNALFISNAKNHLLQSNCGPDNRNLTGNFLIQFINCTITFDRENFRNEELIQEAIPIPGAFHNLHTNWTLIKRYNISEINNAMIENRKILQHIHLEHLKLNFKVWTLFGTMSLSLIACFITIIIIVKKFRTTFSNNKKVVLGIQLNEPRRAVSKVGAVTRSYAYDIEPCADPSHLRFTKPCADRKPKAHHQLKHIVTPFKPAAASIAGSNDRY